MSLLKAAKLPKSFRRRQLSNTIGVAPNWGLVRLEDRVMLAGDAGVAVQSAQVAVAPSTTTHDTASQTHIQATEIAARTIVVIDYRVDDIDSLTKGMDDHAELIVVGQNQDAIDVIGQLIKSSRGKVDALHIVCHGRDGALEIGNGTLDGQTLLEHAGNVQQWSSQMTSDADILLYGCDVAATDKGIQFIRLMSELTGADVAASLNRTGAVDNAADWVLEHSTGNIEAALVFDAATRRSYQHTLNIVINAWGQQGGEQFDLQINGETVQTFTADTTWTPFVYETDADVSGDQVRIVFTNDAFDANTGYDRNLFVNNIQVNGVNFETNSDGTFSTGSYTPEDGVVPGFARGIVLHTNGYFQYGADTSPTVEAGTEITVTAAGQTGSEVFQITAGDAGILGEFQVSTAEQEFVVWTPLDVALEDVRVEFINDLFDPSADYDRNLIVSSIVVTDAETGESDTAIPGNADVFSTGTYLSQDGVTPGFGRGNTLHANGFFQFAPSDVPTGDPSDGPSDDPSGPVSDLTVDTSFGDNGQVLLDSALDLVTLPDGRFAVNVFTGGGSSGTASDLIYFTADGQVDTSRGDNGRVSLFGFAGVGLAAFDDGSILVQSASTTFSSTYTRLDPDGQFDTSFGDDGVVTFPTTTTPEIALTPDGGFIVAGAPITVTFDANDVARFDSSGQLVTSFGDEGVAFFPEAIEFGEPVVTESGDIFVINQSDFTPLAEIIKLTPDGQRDLSFGDSGTFSIATNVDPESDELLASNVQLDSQGRLLFAANVDDDNVQIFRLNPNGTIDTSFNSPIFPDVLSFASEFQFDIDAQDRVVGALNEIVDTDVGRDVTRSIFRLNVDGSFDTSFSSDGIGLVSQEVDVQFVDIDAEDIAVLADGSILLLNNSDISRFFV